MRTLLVAVSLSLLCGCGGGAVKLQFHNDADGPKKQGLNDRSPTVFGMKLIAVYLATDVDPGTSNNVGNTEMIYLNPTCADDIDTCELSPGVNPQDQAQYTHFVTDYFDFAQGSDAVNAAIGAQQRTIAAGSYKHARVEFCKGNQGHVPTVQWAADGVAPREFDAGGCGITSAVFDPPVQVAQGQSVAVTLSYDLSKAVSDEDSSGHVTGFDCVALPSGAHSCIQLPLFVPSAGAQ